VSAGSRGQVAAFAAAVALSSLLLGGAAGIASVAGNGFLGHGQYYVALDELRQVLGRMLYVLGASGAVFAAVLLAVRHSARKPWRAGVLLAALALLYLVIDRFDADYMANLVWSEASLAERLGVTLLLLVSLDLALGRRWGGRLLEAAAPRAVTAVLGTVVALNVAGWGWYAKLQRDLREADSPNVLIIAVDALRADHVSGLGYERLTTPFLDSLAARGTLFSQAVSNSNATRATVPSIFTMVHPSVHGVMAGTRSVLSSRFVTLAEILKNEGYSTQAYMPNPTLKRIFNFDQGFDVYDDRIMGLGRMERYDSAVPINQRVVKWLDANPRTPFFMYIHYVEPHMPYEPPPAYDRMFYGADAAARFRRISDRELELMKRKPGETLSVEIPDLNFYVAQYDAEIRYADDQVKFLLDQLQQRGLFEKTAVFVTADHGEAFLEHGRWMHTNVPPYEEVIHVPLIARLPGHAKPGLRSAAPVHTFDIAATVLDLLGLKPPVPVQARSFLPIVKGDAEQGWEYTFSETPEGRALRNGRWKFLLLESSPGRGGELYDLVADPRETTNLVAANPELASDLEKKLLAVSTINHEMRKGHGVKNRSLDKDTIEQLKALGYVN
jgi:arylsulfatase